MSGWVSGSHEWGIRPVLVILLLALQSWMGSVLVRAGDTSVTVLLLFMGMAIVAGSMFYGVAERPLPACLRRIGQGRIWGFILACGGDAELLRTKRDAGPVLWKYMLENKRVAGLVRGGGKGPFGPPSVLYLSY
jgi:hypothetical protein